jgi:hypothetical protein
MKKPDTSIPKGEVIEDAITRHIDRRFLNSVDLVGKGTVGMTIDRAEKVGQIVHPDGKTSDNKILLYFKEHPRPLMLCAANIKDITLTLGTNVGSEWKGRKVKLCVRKVKAFGKMQDAVRIAD